MALYPRDIKELLAPVKLMSNKHALSAVFRSLEIQPTMVRACASYGIIEIDMQLGVERAFYVDASTFLAVVDSLPAEEDLVLKEDKGALSWQCGSASGRLALVVLDQMPEIGDYPEHEPLAVPPDLPDAVALGALSCDSMSLASMGMHGVVLDGRVAGQLLVCSSDNITISSATSAAEGEGWPERVTIAPEAAALLSVVMQKDGGLLFSDTALYYWDAGTRLMVKQSAPLKHDLAQVMQNFAEAQTVVPIPRERIAAFIKRVGALAESKKSSYVSLHVVDGQLALSFNENVAMSDEYFLVEGLSGFPTELSIKLDAARLARALNHVDRLALDFLGRGTLVFYGGEGDAFVYMVSGKK